MKKILIIMLTLILAIAVTFIVSCKQAETPESTGEPTVTPTEPAPAPTGEPTVTPTEPAPAPEERGAE